MSSQWVIDRRVSAYGQTPAGQLEPIRPTSIQKGDLVDVSVSINVLYSRNKMSSFADIMFEPMKIVRLVEVASLKEIKVSPSLPSHIRAQHSQEFKLPADAQPVSAVQDAHESEDQHDLMDDGFDTGDDGSITDS